MAEDQANSIEFKVDKSNLYREESFTDLKIGAIRRLTPVSPDGSEDKTRDPVFVGHTTIMSPNGPVPIQNAIKAKELQQALEKFPEAMQEAMARMIEEARKMQQQQQEQQQDESRIIVPGR